MLMNGDGKRPEVPPTEVTKPKRRTFTAEEKLRILDEADGCEGKLGALGALLRREGLYSSHLVDWRRARRAGELGGLAPKKRGPKGRAVDARDRRIAELERENSELQRRAEHAEALVELQKKVAALLGRPLPDRSEKP